MRPATVQQAIGIRVSQNADGVVLATLNSGTPAALELARRQGVVVTDADEIFNRMRHVGLGEFAGFWIRVRSVVRVATLLWSYAREAGSRFGVARTMEQGAARERLRSRDRVRPRFRKIPTRRDGARTVAAVKARDYRIRGKYLSNERNQSAVRQRGRPSARDDEASA